MGKTASQSLQLRVGRGLATKRESGHQPSFITPGKSEPSLSIMLCDWHPSREEDSEGPLSAIDFGAVRGQQWYLEAIASAAVEEGGRGRIGHGGQKDTELPRSSLAFGESCWGRCSLHQRFPSGRFPQGLVGGCLQYRCSDSTPRG